jgi:hypothetical protein
MGKDARRNEKTGPVFCRIRAVLGGYFTTVKVKKHVYV